MKKTLLIALLLIPFLGIAQTTKPIEGFLGIKFGASKADVLAAMEAKGAIFDSQQSKPDLSCFNNIKLGHRETYGFAVKFFEGKAYAGYFLLGAGPEPKTIEYYNELVADVNDIYGKGKSARVFKSPYHDGDGDEIMAIKGGYATILTDWKSGTNSIQALIRLDLSISLYYEDNTTAAKVEAAQKAKEKSDF